MAVIRWSKVVTRPFLFSYMAKATCMNRMQNNLCCRFWIPLLIGNLFPHTILWVRLRNPPTAQATTPTKSPSPTNSCKYVVTPHQSTNNQKSNTRSTSLTIRAAPATPQIDGVCMINRYPRNIYTPTHFPITVTEPPDTTIRSWCGLIQLVA